MSRVMPLFTFATGRLVRSLRSDSIALRTGSTAHARRSAILVILAALVGCSDESPEAAKPALTGSAALVEQGRRKARMCTGCHGPAGISRTPTYPSLAGHTQEYLQTQLLAFRRGERNDPMMSSVAMNLSDADIEALSHFFASLPAPQQ